MKFGKPKKCDFTIGLPEELLHWSHHCLHLSLLHYPFKQINRMLEREFMCRRLGNSQSFLYGWRRFVQGLCTVYGVWSPEVKGRHISNGWTVRSRAIVWKWGKYPWSKVLFGVNKGTRTAMSKLGHPPPPPICLNKVSNCCENRGLAIFLGRDGHGVLSVASNGIN